MFELIEKKGLVNVVQTPKGITCQCPVCFSIGNDKTGNHLSILNDGRFNCIAGSGSDPLHNRLLYNLLYKGEDLELIFTPVEPKSHTVKVYDESMLSKLLPDYSYWLGRGISEKVLRELGGGVAPGGQKHKLSNRFCFPIRDVHGRLIGFSGRLIRDNEFAVKWKHIMPSSLALWPLPEARPHILATRKVVVLESIGDALALIQRGIKNVLVIFGVYMSSQMVSTLVSLNPERIIISTNNDSAGNRAGNKAALTIHRRLRSFFDEERLVIHLPDSKDWGVAKDEEFDKLKEIAT